MVRVASKRRALRPCSYRNRSRRWPIPTPHLSLRPRRYAPVLHSVHVKVVRFPPISDLVQRRLRRAAQSTRDSAHPHRLPSVSLLRPLRPSPLLIPSNLRAYLPSGLSPCPEFSPLSQHHHHTGAPSPLQRTCTLSPSTVCPSFRPLHSEATPCGYLPRRTADFSCPWWIRATRLCGSP